MIAYGNIHLEGKMLVSKRCFVNNSNIIYNITVS